MAPPTLRGWTGCPWALSVPGRGCQDGPMDGIAALRRMIEDAGRVALFTGAGISTESGIPDFRSPTGIWKTSTPIMFQDFVRSAEARREAWQRKFASDPVL